MKGPCASEGRYAIAAAPVSLTIEGRGAKFAARWIGCRGWYFGSRTTYNVVTFGGRVQVQRSVKGVSESFIILYKIINEMVSLDGERERALLSFKFKKRPSTHRFLGDNHF